MAGAVALWEGCEGKPARLCGECRAGHPGRVGRGRADEQPGFQVGGRQKTPGSRCRCPGWPLPARWQPPERLGWLAAVGQLCVKAAVCAVRESPCPTSFLVIEKEEGNVCIRNICGVHHNCT